MVEGVICRSAAVLTQAASTISPWVHSVSNITLVWCFSENKMYRVEDDSKGELTVVAEGETLIARNASNFLQDECLSGCRVGDCVGGSGRGYGSACAGGGSPVIGCLAGSCASVRLSFSLVVSRGERSKSSSVTGLGLGYQGSCCRSEEEDVEELHCEDG